MVAAAEQRKQQQQQDEEVPVGSQEGRGDLQRGAQGAERQGREVLCHQVYEEQVRQHRSGEALSQRTCTRSVQRGMCIVTAKKKMFSFLRVGMERRPAQRGRSGDAFKFAMLLEPARIAWWSLLIQLDLKTRTSSRIVPTDPSQNLGYHATTP